MKETTMDMASSRWKNSKLNRADRKNCQPFFDRKQKEDNKKETKESLFDIMNPQ